MIGKAPERILHLFRWVLVIGWLVLIASFFYDPISPAWTDPDLAFSPFADRLLALESHQCVRVQGECLQEQLYPIGAKVFWGMVVPSGIFIVLVLGHEFWRRLCPLYFLSQIPRALGLKPILKIANARWLQTNHLYLQFFLLFLGVNLRILLVNSTPLLLGSFLLLTIAAAIAIVALYGGRSWCHYVCPFGLVQLIFTGPKGLLGASAHQMPANAITQSSCRTIDAKTGEEKPACIGCKSNCFDIDAEKSYWQQLTQPGRQFAHYGYLGIVAGYILYFFLYAGNWHYYFSGAWTHEENQLETLMQSGFYLSDRPLPIPKLLAVPLTFIACIALSYYLGRKLENYLKRRDRSLSSEQVRHRAFSLFTGLSFNLFFLYGGRPIILKWPLPWQFAFQSLIVSVSILWLYRTYQRTSQQYLKESLKDRFIRQLKKLPIDFSQYLQNRSLEDLKPDELEVLDLVLPQISLQERSQVYKGVLTEALSRGMLNTSHHFNFLQYLGIQCQIEPEEYARLVKEIVAENPHILQKASEDNQLRIQSYKAALESSIVELVESGMSRDEAIALKRPQIRALRREYRIGAEEQARILSEGILQQDGELWRRAEVYLERLQVWGTRWQILHLFLLQNDNPIWILLQETVESEQKQVLIPLLKKLEFLGGEKNGLKLARRTGLLAHNILPDLLAEPSLSWQKRLDPEVLELLQSSVNRELSDRAEVSISRERLLAVLDDLLAEENPFLQAVSLRALYTIDSHQSKARSHEILSHSSPHPLLEETAKSLLEYSDLGMFARLLHYFEPTEIKRLVLALKN
ncbi:MAG: 4Fe-4S binding protein [Cyanobacteria bacterium SBLK]|nr:4Fe-4S binding protein [Cyanobacteria bacterium SBLK]